MSTRLGPNEHHLVPGQLREVVQGGDGGLVTILHVLVTHATQETPDIVITSTSGASVVDIQDPVSELAEEHGECLEYRGVHPVRSSVREHNKRHGLAGLGPDIVSCEARAGGEGEWLPCETRDGTRP